MISLKDAGLTVGGLIIGGELYLEFAFTSSFKSSGLEISYVPHSPS